MKVWLCIEPSMDGPRISNLPGGPNHCYITGRPKHRPDCGWKLLVSVDTSSKARATEAFVAKLKVRSRLADETGSTFWVDPQFVVEDLLEALAQIAEPV